LYFYNFEQERYFPMKKTLIYLAFVLTLIFKTGVVFSQMSFNHYLEQCSWKLGDFKFLKVFEIDGKKFKVTNIAEKKFFYIFSKNKEYKIVLCGGQSNSITNIIINVFDSDGQLKVSSYNKRLIRDNSQILFKCESTGIYYMSVYCRIQNPYKDSAFLILGSKED